MEDRCHKTMHAVITPTFTLSQAKHPPPGSHHPLVNSSGYMQWHYQKSHCNEKMTRNATPNTICRRQEPFQRTNSQQIGILEAEWNYYRNRNSLEQCAKFDRSMPVRHRAAPKPFNRSFSGSCSSMARTFSKIEISVKTGNVIKYSTNDQYAYANLTNTASDSMQNAKMQQYDSNLEAKRYPSEDKIRIKSNTASNNPKRRNEIGSSCREPKISYNNRTELNGKRTQPNQNSTQKTYRELENSEETAQAAARQINGKPHVAGEPLAAHPQVAKTPKRALKRPAQAQTDNDSETVDKKSRADNSRGFGFIEKLNLHIGMTYLPDSRKETSTADLDAPIKHLPKQITASRDSNQMQFRKKKQRSKSFCLLNRAPSSRTTNLLKAKSLTHLPHLEELSSLKLADCGKYIRSWPMPQLPHFDPPKSPRYSLNQWKEASVSDPSRVQSSSDVKQVSDSCADISPLRKKRRRICFIDSSDEEAEATNKKSRNRKSFDSGRAGGKSEAKKSKPLDPQKGKHFTTKPLIYDGQVKNDVTRKQMLLLLFGEDSDNDEAASQKSSAAPKSSTQERKSRRNRQESKHKKGNHVSKKHNSGEGKLTRPHNKHDPLERSKCCTDRRENASNRKLILTDLFPDPSQEFKKMKNKTKKEANKTLKRPSHQEAKTQTPPRVKQLSKTDGKPSLTSDNRPKIKEKHICKSEAAATDNKLTSPKFPCKSFPEPRFAMHKELVVELQSCSILSLPNWPTHQKAKATSEKEHCTETCYINDAVDEKIASKVLKTEVVVKEEELDDSCLMVYTCVKIESDSEEAFKLKDEPIHGKSKEAAIGNHFSGPSQNLEQENNYYEGLPPNSLSAYKQSSKESEISSSNMHLRVAHQDVQQTMIENIQEFTSAPGASLRLATYQCPEPQQCLIEFENSLPLPSAAPFAMQRAKQSRQAKHCEETCQANDAADVKNDSQVVKSVVEVDHGVITFYSCTDVQNDDDEVQIVSVTVPATLQDNNTNILCRPKEEQPETSLNAMSFVVNLQSMGSALISCGAVSKEPKDMPSTSTVQAQSSSRLTSPAVIENPEPNLNRVSRAEKTVIGSVLQGSECRYLPPRTMVSTQPNAALTAAHLGQLIQRYPTPEHISNRNIMTSKRMHKEPESVYVPSSSIVSSEPNLPQCTASTVVQISQTSEDHLVLSVRDRTLIEQTMFSHIYFLMHLFNAQRVYLNCLQGRMFCKHFFNCEVQWFEQDKNRRISCLSKEMCTRLLQLRIKASKNLAVCAEGIVDNVIEMLLKADMNKQVSKSGVYLCLWMLMSGEADMYASVPLFKVMLRHAYLVFSKLNSRYVPTFSNEMRQTLIRQIQEYNRLVEWSFRTGREVQIASNQSGSAPTSSLYPQNRFGNGGSVHNIVNAAGFPVNQQPIGIPTIQTVAMCASPSSSFFPQNTMFTTTAQRLETNRGACNTTAYNPISPLRVVKPRRALQPVNLGPPLLHTVPTVFHQSAASTSSRSLPQLSPFEKSFSINDNFRIKLPYSRPITSVTTCSRPLTSMAPSGLSTPLADCLAKEPSKLLNQGIGALSWIGQSSLMLSCNHSEQELTKSPVADTSGSLPSVDSLQQDTASAGSPALTSTVGAPEGELKNKPVQRNNSPCPAAARARCSSAASSEEVETIDLTWLDDMDQEELNEEMDFVCVKPEISNECSEIAQESNEDVMYTIVYDTNMCICDETPKYRCNCGQAWYCGKACQLKDWGSHRKVCQVVSETKKTDLPLPDT